VFSGCQLREADATLFQHARQGSKERGTSFWVAQHCLFELAPLARFVFERFSVNAPRLSGLQPIREIQAWFSRPRLCMERIGGDGLFELR
jgi:hypothetical protein